QHLDRSCVASSWDVVSARAGLPPGSATYEPGGRRMVSGAGAFEVVESGTDRVPGLAGLPRVAGSGWVLTTYSPGRTRAASVPDRTAPHHRAPDAPSPGSH